jgi:tetratricopeptide (TPR) repeat protein
MPLAILLAAAWMELLTPGEIAAEISRSLDFLETDARDVPGRQRSIRAVFNHSWDLLSEREQESFAGLSVFRGGFTRQAAQRVTGISLRELMGLVNKSLLHRASTGRCRIHELLRQYAAEKLDGSPDGGNAVRDRHSAYYANALQTWEAGLKGTGKPAALAEMDVKVENARAAWDWAVERGQVERLSRAIDGLCRFYVCRGRYKEGESLCRRTVEAFGPSPRERETRALAQALAWQGVFGRILGRTELARQLLKDSLTLLDQPAMASQGVEEERAFVLWELGYTVHQLGKAQEAKHLAAQSLDTYRALGDRWGTSRALWFLGSMATWANAYQEAKQLHRESLAIRRELGDPSEIAESLVALGRIAYSQEQLAEAEDLIRQGLAIYRQAGDRPGTAWGLHFLANLEQGRGNFAQVASLEAQSMAIYRELGYRRHLATSLRALGVAEMNLGRYEQACARFQMSLDIHREVNHPHGVAATFFCLGGAALAREAYAEARRLIQESLAIYRKIGYPRELGYILVCLGIAECGLGRPGEAQPYVREGLQSIAESGHFYAAFALPGIATLYVCRGESARAVELYALASRYPLVANSCLLKDIAGRHIAAVAAALPPEAVAAAQERGRARDLWATMEELLEELEG